jgi:DNA-binding transcriptional LysR family regulator
MADRSILDDLGLLRAVVESGSFVRAGRALGLTQSAVSRAVARLEERVGLRLFQRTARASSLTEEGRRYYTSIAPHLSAIEEATIEAGSANREVRGRLRVNIDGGIGQFLIVPNLGPFLEAHPGLTLELVMRERLGELVSEGFDVAVRFGELEPSALKARLLLRTRVITCASPAYLAKHGTPKTPGDITRHQCIQLRQPSTGAPFAWEFVRGKKVVPVQTRGQLFVNNTGPLIASCVSGLGVTQLLELYSGEYLKSGQLVRLLPEWNDELYPLYAYYHPAQRLSARVRAFLDFVVQLTKASGEGAVR